MEIQFTGKRIIVTGAGRGIGREIVIQLVKCGADVIAISRTKKHLESLKELVPSIEIIELDLRDWDKTRAALENIGAVDGLVNNAGVAVLEPFLEITKESVDYIIDVNLKSVINVSQIIAKNMVARGRGGSIVHVSSQTALIGLRDHSVYSSTKGALDALCRTMALELGPHNIRVNCVNPTVINTEMGFYGWSDPVKRQDHISKIPLGRFGEEEEVAHAVLYLLSDKSTMVHGVSLPIDGGYTAV